MERIDQTQTLWHIGVSDPSLRVFRQVSFTEQGLLYGSYLLDTGAGYLLLGTVPRRHYRQWLENIRSVTPPDGVKWAVIFGGEDELAGAKLLLEQCPDLTLIAGTGTLFRLRQGLPAGFQSIEIRTSRTLRLGERELLFQVVPEKFATASLYVVDEAGKTLFTADAFGSDYAGERPLLSELPDPTDYFRGAKRYYADLLGRKRKDSLAQAVALLRTHDIQRICPALGPVADCGLERLTALYTEEGPAAPHPNVAIVYAGSELLSGLAAQVRQGLTEAGIGAVTCYDLSAESRDEVLAALPAADAILFGVDGIWGNADKALWDMATSLLKEDCKGKLASVFYRAAAGELVEDFRQRLTDLGFTLTLQDFFVQGQPTEQDNKHALDYGFGVGCSVLRVPNPRKPTLVKCLVCGEIFDASLGACPVCGVGLEQCVPVEEDDALFHQDTDRRYVVVGGGVAAVSAAEAIRRRDETGSVLMLSAEPGLPINRPMLTKDIQTAAEAPEQLAIHPLEWYQERAIDLRLGCTVTAMDTAEKTVTTADGDCIPYDKLVIATGAECFIPPFEGWQKPGVLTIRHLADSAALAGLMQNATQAVVIGGGVLGLEAASELLRSGLKVTVLEASPQIIGRQADAKSAALLREQMAAMGVACYEGVSIAAVEGEERATAVRLGDGRVFPADFVIVSCGNRGNVQAAKAAGIAVERSIVVNQRMETSAADVYACGDCAQFDGMNYQLWAEASGQGTVAGANAAGEKLTYANQLLGLSLEGFGTTLFAIGDPGKKPDVPYQTVEVSDSLRNRHETYWFFGGSLEGTVVIGAQEKVPQLTQAVTTHARYSELF
ncbi:MAG: FAD-dependent oxidoreductase [Clostridiales bacterium]|nr:FAD-dependent oxidoreductase [Clostridiales bacterium]